MKLTFHGAGQEVGRSCIELRHGGRRLLFDGGIKIEKEKNLFPTKVQNISGIQAMFLSHAHMDHSGALPLLYHQGLRCPVVCTACTKDITRVLLKDSWKIDRIEGREKTYGKEAIRSVLDNMILDEKGSVAGVRYSLHPTGHIPSSMATLVEFDGLRVLYSGDVNGTTTQLLEGVTRYPCADVLILESTYGNRNHPPRRDTWEEFIAVVRETLGRGGSVLCASFAVGRAQELMILLTKAGLRKPIYLDGMSRKILSIFLRHDYELKDGYLHRAAERVSNVNSWKMRKKIASQQSVIIATSGMMDAGPVLGYLKHLYKDPRNCVIATGYQAAGTNGRMLLETGHIELDGHMVKVDAQVEHFDMSAHASMNDLRRIIDSVRPKHLVLNHGDYEAELGLVPYAKKKGIKVYVPKTGETVDLRI